VQDAEPYCFLLGDNGLDIYSNSIGVRADFIEKNPEVVRGFVRAALRGWKDALANPEEAAKLQLQFLRALDPAIVAEEVRILKRLAVTPDTEKNGFGTMTKEKMQRTIDFINDNVDVKGDKRILANVMVDGFLPREPIKP
jgi:NitT/TauT family transport system substrate-binding protein